MGCALSEISPSDLTLLEEVSAFVRSRRLEIPAVWLLEIHLPLCNVLYHGWLFCLPAVSPFIGKGQAERVSRVLSERANVETLIEMLRGDVSAPPTAGCRAVPVKPNGTA